MEGYPTATVNGIAGVGDEAAAAVSVLTGGLIGPLAASAFINTRYFAVSVAAMSVAAITVAAAGRIAVGGPPLPRRAGGVFGRVASVLLAPLVAVEVFTRIERMVLDTRAAGASAAIALCGAALVAMLTASVMTAAVRLF
jgi:hypothetical protein